MFINIFVYIVFDKNCTFQLIANCVARVNSGVIYRSPHQVVSMMKPLCLGVLEENCLHVIPSHIYITGPKELEVVKTRKWV